MEEDTFLHDMEKSGVGFSDAVLIGVSVIGFAMLSMTIYSLIWMRLDASAAGDAKDGEEEVDYDEMLDRADVSKLNRAQRRARAKNRMKKQRRIAPATGAPAAEGGDNDDDPSGQQDQHMSRKERQKAAKEMELKERRLFEDQRREMQRKAMEAAQREKKERDVQEAQQSRKQKLEKEEEKRKLEEAELEAWNTFLVSKDGTVKVSVQEFLATLKSDKVVDADDYAEQLRVPTRKVIERIRKLERLDLVTGIWDDRNRFIHVTPEELAAMAAFIKEKGRVSSSQLAAAMKDMIATTKSE